MRPATAFDAFPGTGGGPISEYGVTMASTPAPPDGLHTTEVTRFENYEILRKEDGAVWELGRGAMGITYKAQDTDLHVPVALKVINPSTLGASDARERFLREARAAAKLRHANIASVFRLGRVGDTHFYAMEFCEGQTVHQLVDRRGPLELKLALEITLQVAQALVVAQEHGVVHRDIKPSNLMVTGRVPDEFTIKVIDFGLAKHTSADTAAPDITVSSQRRGFVGTAHFASPEQLEDRPVDARSDIYSLGVTLWFMLTGRPLFEGSLTRVVTQHIMQPPPMDKLAWLPAPVADILDKMLAKEADDRPRTARELRGKLQQAIEGLDAASTIAATMPIVRVAGSVPASSQAPAAFSTPDSLARDRQKLEQHPHPVLCAGEHGVGISLAETAAAQGPLPLSEVVHLLEPLGASIDDARRLGLHALDLDLGRVGVQFPGHLPDAARREILGHPIREWPPYGLKVNALAARPLDPQEAIRELVRIALSLLGAPPTSAGFTPIARISAGGNELLKQAFEGQRKFGTAAEFLGALGAFATLRGATQPPSGSGARFAPPSPGESAATMRAPASLPPPMPQASHAPLPPPPPPSYAPAQPQPLTSAKPLLIGGLAFLFLLAILMSVLVFSPIGNKLMGRSGSATPAPVEDARVPNGDSSTPGSATASNQPPTPAPETAGTASPARIAADAFREVRLAQTAAESFSTNSYNLEANTELLEVVQERPNPDPEAINQYRKMLSDNQRGILDAEQALLISAKRLNENTPDVIRAAFDQLDEDVSRSGIGWRNRIVELLRRHVPQIGQEDLRISPQFREELKELQSGN